MMVSVNIPAYNHEKYIEQAVNSALMQKTNFDYEILIGEDDSTDNTKQLVIDLAKKHPDKIKLFFNDGKPKAIINGRKVGMLNFIKLLKEAKGKYIALLDGDDYWTDPYKLQKQVDYMETHPDCSLTFHNVLLIDDNNNIISEYKFNESNITDFEYIAEVGVVGHTSSIVIKNFFGILGINWENKYLMGHTAIHFLSLMNGYMHNIDRFMGVYRISDQGIWSKLSTQKQFEWKITGTRLFLKQFDKRFHKGLRKSLSRTEYDLSIIHLKNRNLILFIKFQYYAIINSHKGSGLKVTFGLLKHTIKCLLGFIPKKK